MNKLQQCKDENGNYYSIPYEEKLRFRSRQPLYKRKLTDKCFEFSFIQAKEVNQWRSRNGGCHERSPIEMFCDTMQGKTAEEIVYEYCSSVLRQKCSEVDYSRTPRGISDIFDMEIGNRIASVKSIPFYGNLLLLERGSIEKAINKHNLFIVARVFPSVEEIVKDNNLWRDDFDDEHYVGLKDVCMNTIFEIELTGYYKKEDVKKIHNEEHLVLQGERFGRKTIFDADNYYSFVYHLRPMPTKEKQ